MKNNLHTELREKWIEFNEEMSFTTPEERDIIADWWLEKLDELTNQVSIQDDIQVVENPECIHCGLLKSTIDASNYNCLADKRMGPEFRREHEFQSATSPDAIVKQDTLEELIDECGNRFQFVEKNPHENNVVGWNSFPWTALSTDGIRTFGFTAKEAVEKLLKELKK